MKRIVLTLTALIFSVSGAMAEDLDSYGSVLQDQVSQSSSYSAPDTYNENHGSVLLDEVSRGIDSEVAVGDSNSTLFDTDSDFNF